MRSRSCLLLLVAFAGAAAASTASPTPLAPLIFEPTDEWQEIQSHQQIPGGLDVRMDLSAGKKWARNLQQPSKSPAAIKIIDKASAVQAVDAPAAASGGLVVLPDPAASLDTSSLQARRETRARARKGKVAHARPNTVNSIISASGDVDSAAGAGAAPAATATPSPTPTPDDGLDERTREMQNVLLGLPNPEPELSDAIASRLPPEQLKAVLSRLWERRQAELKEVFGSTRTEAQQMQGLIQQLLGAPAPDANGEVDQTTPLSIEARVSLLRDIEFFVAQLHNAQDFTAMGGLAAVAHLLNDSSLDVALHAAWVVGTAVKYAPDLQAAALREGALPALLALLHRGLDEHALAMHAGGAFKVAVQEATTEGAPVSAVYADVPLAAVAKALYALGGLLRTSGEGQAQFVALGGPRALERTLMACVAGLRHGATQQVTTAAATEPGVLVAAGNPLLRPVRALAGRTLTLLADLHEEHTQSLQQQGDLAGEGGGVEAFRDGTTRIVLNSRAKEAAAAEEDGALELARFAALAAAAAGDSGVNDTSPVTAVVPPIGGAPVTGRGGTAAPRGTRALGTLIGPSADPAGSPATLCGVAADTVGAFTGASAAAASAAGGAVSEAATSAITGAWEVMRPACVTMASGSDTAATTAAAGTPA